MTSPFQRFSSHMADPTSSLATRQRATIWKSCRAILPRPRAIVISSAHFETDGVAVVTDPAPEMIYDFRGFAPELYEMVYPAPGDPALAERVLGLLAEAGLAPKRAERRGYDHGTWTPLKLAFPGADIPVVQVSIDPNRDADVASCRRPGACPASP